MSTAAQTWLLVGLAGAVGTLLRYAVGGWIARLTGGVFPWETFAINVAGCLAIGVLAAGVDRGALLPPPLRMALTVGLLGGFTTFSSFALETFRLGESGRWAGAGLYVLLTNGVGLVATWVGYGIGRLAW